MIDKSHGLNLCLCCVGSHENWKTQAHFFRNADNYQNCCWEWCWKNYGWQVSNSIGSIIEPYEYFSKQEQGDNGNAT